MYITCYKITISQECHANIFHVNTLAKTFILKGKKKPMNVHH